MDRLKKFLTSLAEYPRALYNIASGKTARDAARLRQECADLRQRMEAQRVDMHDHMALKEFQARRAAEYFNEAAAKQPEMAQEYKRLADLAATVDLGKMRGDVSAYAPEEAANREWHTVRERYADEIDRYVSAKIGAFVAEDPLRWQRIEKSSPDIAAKLKPPQP